LAKKKKGTVDKSEWVAKQRVVKIGGETKVVGGEYEAEESIRQWSEENKIVMVEGAICMKEFSRKVESIGK